MRHSFCLCKVFITPKPKSFRFSFLKLILFPLLVSFVKLILSPLLVNSLCLSPKMSSTIISEHIKTGRAKNQTNQR